MSDQSLSFLNIDEYSSTSDISLNRRSNMRLTDPNSPILKLVEHERNPFILTYESGPEDNNVHEYIMYDTETKRFVRDGSDFTFTSNMKLPLYVNKTVAAIMTPTSVFYLTSNILVIYARMRLWMYNRLEGGKMRSRKLMKQRFRRYFSDDPLHVEFLHELVYVHQHSNVVYINTNIMDKHRSPNFIVKLQNNYVIDRAICNRNICGVHCHNTLTKRLHLVIIIIDSGRDNWIIADCFEDNGEEMIKTKSIATIIN